MKYAFFGTPAVAKIALETLIGKRLVPQLVVTAPDAPSGRGLRLTPSPVKTFALEQQIAVATPEKITKEFIAELSAQGPWDFFVVVAYGKILPESLLAISAHGVLNIHPSLLPKYRGPAPLESVLLSDDTETGVTIMLLDTEVDHGPVLVQEQWPLPETETFETLAEKSFIRGGELIAELAPKLLDKTVTPAEQDHAQATFTKKFIKEDGLVRLEETPWELWKKYRALHRRPGLYFFHEKEGKSMRIKIKSARWEGGRFIIETVIPENGRPIPFERLYYLQ